MNLRVLDLKLQEAGDENTVWRTVKTRVLLLSYLGRIIHGHYPED